ncbi:MAG TPA: hypothetical protein VL336_08140 [Sphingomicrobium sp.]|jgi:hypothetical protein|nr:hypothetical protein [Sphingomicrobium sp.]
MMGRLAILGLAAALLATGASAQQDSRTSDVLAAVRAQLRPDGFAEGASYAIVFSDLNDDHQQEAIVHLNDRNFCGSGGCTTFVLTPTDAGWHMIGRMTVSRLPIYRLPEHHSGWFDLGVFVSGGGAQPGVRAVRFDRGRYQSNPSKGPRIGRLPQEASSLLAVDSEFFLIGPN